ERRSTGYKTLLNFLGTSWSHIEVNIFPNFCYLMVYLSIDDIENFFRQVTVVIECSLKILSFLITHTHLSLDLFGNQTSPYRNFLCEDRPASLINYNFSTLGPAIQ